MRRTIYVAVIALALTPVPAFGASTFLHFSEAHSFRDHFAAKYDTKLQASRVVKGACRRIDSQHIECPVTFYRYYQWSDGGTDYQRCPYVVRVSKAHDGRYGYRLRGSMGGYCGEAEMAR